MENSKQSILKNFKFIPIDFNKSIISNFSIIQENFKRLLAVFVKFEDITNKISNDFNIDVLSSEIRREIIENKIKIPVSVGLNINSTNVHSIENSNFNFVITRESIQSFSIVQSESDKVKINMSDLIVQCKQQISEVILYPIIQCFEDKIIITFSEAVNQGFTVILF